MAQPKVLLYAELLPNIRQISVMIAFNTLSDPTTKGELSDDGQLLHLSHGGATYTLELPGQAVATTNLQRTFEARKEISWRLPVAALPGTSVERGQDNEAPWPAKDLDQRSSFCCRGCNAIVVPADIIKSWKDLPSENWAEMMDFWHCHKPDPEKGDGKPQAGHNHGDANASKAYGANTKFVAQPGIGFVDSTTFLFSNLDYSNLQVCLEDGASLHNRTISCRACLAAMGYMDVEAIGVRLYKWRLSRPNSSKSPALTPPISVFVSARLLSILQAQCSSKALLIPEGSASSGTLHLWVLQQSLYYSSSATQTGRTFAMKVLWKPVSNAESTKLIDTQKAEDIILPRDAVVEIEKHLRESARLLPPNARLFQGWNVGLLERYEEEK